MKLALNDDIAKHCHLTTGYTRLHSEMNTPPPHVMTGAESDQPVGAPFYQWVGCRDIAGLRCFAPLGVGRLREDQFIYVETREDVFFIIWDL